MLRKTQQLLALVLGLFLISHIGVHLFAIAGPQTHERALETIQWIYRNPVIEPLLIIAILVQIYTGARFVRLRWKSKNKSTWSQIQIVSGLYMAAFFIMHTSAALTTRHIFNLDTNFYWAAGTVITDPILWGFRPYYFLGIVAVFSHLAAALYFKRQAADKPHLISHSLILSGIVIATLIVSSLSGAFYEIQLPQEYNDFYQGYVNLIKPH